MDLEDWSFADDFVGEVNFTTNFSGAHLDPTHALNDQVYEFENITLKGDVDFIMIGDDNNNTIITDGGNDKLYGGVGNDLLSSGDGNDFIYGEDGDDLIIHNGSGKQEYHGGLGNDTLNIDLTYSSNLSEDFVGEVDLVNGWNGPENDPDHELSDKLSGIENIKVIGDKDYIIRGDEQDNILKSDSGDDYLYGGDGNDVLKSGAGDDFIYGEAGDDILILNGSGTQEFDGGEGIDTFKLDQTSFTRPLNPDYEQVVEIDLIRGISGQKDNVNLQDTLISIENIKYQGSTDVEMTGDSNDNIIYSHHGNDIIYAGGGNDFINSGDGSDVITTGSGLDTIVIKPGHVNYTLGGADRITDFEDGSDQFALDGMSFSDITIEQGIFGEYVNHTILTTSDGWLGVLENTTASDVNADDFYPITATFTASIDKWQPGGQTSSNWLDGPVMKLHRDEIVIGEPVYIGDTNDITATTKPSIETISNDKILTTWLGTDGTLQGQFISKSGDNLGPQFLISSNANHSIAWSTELLDGNIFVTWCNQFNNGYGQIISPTGEKIGSEFSIASFANAPIPTSLSDGSVFVTYRISNTQTEGKFYNKDGLAISDPLTIYDISPKVAELSNGNIIITSGNKEIYGKIIDSSGNVIKSDFAIANNPIYMEQQSSVVALKDGGFAVTWQDEGQDGDDFGLYMRIYNNDGTSLTDPILVNTKTSDHQSYSVGGGNQVSSIEQLDSGELVIVFNDRENSYYDIYAQKFDILGNKIGDAFLINTFTDEQQVNANITSLGDGGYAVVWEDIYQGNSQVKTKIFEVGIDLTAKPDTPGHKHKPDMDKGEYELRVEHDQQTDGAIDIDDVMGVLSLSRGKSSPASKEHKLAADWNGDGIIDIDDVMGVLARSRGKSKEDEWRFHDKTSDTSLWDNATKTNKMDITLEENDDIDLTAILRGDVNGSYNANEHNRARSITGTDT